MTRPQIYDNPLSQHQLSELVAKLEKSFLVAEDSANVTKELLALLEKIPAKGKQVHDANIVATMCVHRVSALLTHNRADFERYKGIIDVLWIGSQPH